MKNVSKSLRIILAVLFFLIILSNNLVFGAIELSPIEYSEEYKKYLELSDEEKKKVIMPRMYNDNTKISNSDYFKNMKNAFKITSLLKSSLDPDYNLTEVIPENTKIRNQMSTGGCWAFAILGSLETNLALQDKQEANTTKTYDFSERHMVYATVRKAFLNDAINEKGFEKEISGGNNYVGNAYLTNGMGAVPESELTFENNEDKIDIKKIQNKKVTTEVIDTILYETPKTTQEKEDLKAKIKSHITNYGGVATYIHGAEILSEYYNNDTGAIYCESSSKCPPDHEVLIIGWDDVYDKSNFNELHRPQSNGAWIIKNSWGEKQEFSMLEQKQEIYNSYPTQCNSKGWYSANDIPDEFILELLEESGYSRKKMTVTGDALSIEIGNKGYMYISYEDANVFNNMYGIEKATNEKVSDYIYQYDELGCNNIIELNTNEGYLANVFERDKTKSEVLTKISINTLLDIGKCKVYVNPNNNSKKLSDLQEVTLAEGQYETITTGYNTIEFASPIKLNGDSFVVVLKVEDISIKVPLISNVKNSYYQEVKLKQGKSFVTTKNEIANNEWLDLTSTELDESLRGNISLKAFTKSEKQEVLLSGIQVSKEPNKLKYNIGEKFDSTGMKILANYTDGSKKEVVGYKVTNGDSLKLGQTSVTITYTECEITKTTTQNITVQKPVATITKIEIKTKPTKLEYTRNVDNLTLAGGIIKATYSDSTTEEIPMNNSAVTAKGYDKTKLGEQTITISYKGKTATFKITVKEGKTQEIEKEEENPAPSNFKNAKAKITNATSYIYIKLDKTEYTTMKIKVEGIKLGDEKSSREYYYYISGKQAENNIEENCWVKISKLEKDSNGNYGVTIELDSRKMKNLKEIEQEENLYLYIKEKSTLNNKNIVTVNQINVTLETQPEIYVDDIKNGNIDDTINNNVENDKDTNKETDKPQKDTTTATGIIPQTGVKITIFTIIITLIIGSICIFIKINKMKDIK